MAPILRLLTIYLANTTSTGVINCDPSAPTTPCNTGLPAVDTTSAVHVITQIAFGVIGALAVVIMIIAGIRMVTSGGDPDAVASARNTLIYASLGLVVAISAELLVTFILTSL